MSILSKVRPSGLRVFSTLRSKLIGGSDAKRWSNLTSLDSEWKNRAARIASHIKSGSRVMDIGAGAMDLEKCLPDDCFYQPADIVSRREGCLVVDLNKGDFPSGEYDVITFLGVLEYVHDVNTVLVRCSELSERVVISYCIGRWFSPLYRLSMGWVNNLSIKNFEYSFAQAGFRIDTVEVFKSKILHEEVILVAIKQ